MSINQNSTTPQSDSQPLRTRKHGWAVKINIGQYLVRYEADQETSPRTIALLIASELERAILPTWMFGAGRERSELVADFRLVTDDIEELDDCLARMYDWGDYHRVWFVPVFQVQAEEARNNDYDWRSDTNTYPFDTVVEVYAPAGVGGSDYAGPNPAGEGPEPAPVDDYEKLTVEQFDAAFKAHIEAVTQPADADATSAGGDSSVDAIRQRMQRFSHLFIEGTYTDAEAVEYVEQAVSDISALLKLIHTLEAERPLSDAEASAYVRSYIAITDHEDDEPPPQAKTAKLTKKQQVVVGLLLDGWRINAPIYLGMTNWIRPNGTHTRNACPFPTLKALEKKGVVSHEGGEWQLTATGRQRASEGGAR